MSIAKPWSILDLKDMYVGRLAHKWRHTGPSVGWKYANLLTIFLTIISTGPPNQLPSAPDPATSMSTNSNEQASMVAGIPCIMIVLTDAEDPDYEVYSAPDLRSVFGTHLPFEVSKEGVVTIQKDGVWHPAGECTNCSDLGPAHFHCTQCYLRGLIYETVDMSPDEAVADPQKMGLLASLVNATFFKKTKPAAS
jgi:hypothetical protein